jgi:hypothetical protein
MGMESFGNIPTKESLQSTLADLQKSKEVYANRLIQAQDTPVSALFSEGEKKMAIDNHQRMVDQINTEIADIETKLAELES